MGYHSYMKARKGRKIEGFSILEILVSIVVIAILSGITLTGVRGLMHRQRYTGAAERVRLLVQQARNRSQTQISTSKTFGVYFSFGGANTEVSLLEDDGSKNGVLDATDKIVEKLIIDPLDLNISLKKDANVACNVSGAIMFNTKSTGATLYCDNISDQVNTLKINLQSTQIESLIRQYMINKTSGTIQ